MSWKMSRKGERSSRDRACGENLCCEVTSAGSSSGFFPGVGVEYLVKWSSSILAIRQKLMQIRSGKRLPDLFVRFSCLTFCLRPDSGVDAAVLEGFRWHSGKQSNLDACRNHPVLSICGGISQRHPPDGDCALRKVLASERPESVCFRFRSTTHHQHQR